MNPGFFVKTVAAVYDCRVENKCPDCAKIFAFLKKQ